MLRMMRIECERRQLARPCIYKYRPHNSKVNSLSARLEPNRSIFVVFCVTETSTIEYDFVIRQTIFYRAKIGN